MEGYNGWTNWQTWNVALWIGNDESLYELAKRFVHYKDLANYLVESGTYNTPDGASYTDAELDTDALSEWMTDDMWPVTPWVSGDYKKNRHGRKTRKTLTCKGLQGKPARGSCKNIVER